MDFDEYPVIDRLKTGHTLKRIMQRRGITSSDVQGYLNLACVQSVYRWLAGINIPTVDNLYALSQLLQVPIDQLICGSRDTKGEKQMGQMNNGFQKRREEKIRELRKKLQEEGYAEFYIKSYIKGFFIGYHQSLAEFVRKEVLTVEEIEDLIYMDKEEFKDKYVLTDE